MKDCGYDDLSLVTVQRCDGEVETLHLSFSDCTVLEDLGLRSLGDAIPKLSSSCAAVGTWDRTQGVGVLPGLLLMFDMVN